MNVDQDFAAYQETRDPAALARVFDATATSLLCVAIHLTRDEAAAHDLVQTTYLRMIEKAHTWDPKRPLRPWMNGILANETAMWRRRGRRDDSASAPPHTETDPAERAEIEEAAEVLTRALRGLPERYRAVVRLRLMHGLTSPEVGRVLDLPQETVRTRARRGLQLLRAALPESLAAVTLSVLGAAELTDIRALIVSAAANPLPWTEASSSSTGGEGAESTGSTPSPGTLSPGTLSPGATAPHSNGLVALAAAVLVSTCAVGFALFGDHSPGGSVDSSKHVVASDSVIPTQATPTDPLRAEPTPPDPAPDQTTFPSIDSGWTVRGQVRDKLGRGVPNARVRVDLVRGVREQTIAEVSTDPDGSWSADVSQARALSVLQRANASIFAIATASAHGSGEGDWVLDLPALPLDQASFDLDLILSQTDEVYGQVFDSRSHPVVGADVYAVSHLSGGTQHRTKTGIGGYFRIPSIDGPAEIHVWSEQAGVGLKRNVALTPGLTLPTIVLDAGLTLDVPIVLLDGRPAAGLRVFVGPDDPNTPVPLAWLSRSIPITLPSDGRLRLSGLTQGDWRMTTTSIAGTSQEHTVAAGKPAAEWRIEGHLVRVQVNDEVGEPLLGTPVTVSLFHPNQVHSNPAWIDYGVTPDSEAIVTFLLPTEYHATFSALVLGASRATHAWKPLGGTHRYDVRLQLQQVAGAGRLKLDAIGPGGVEVSTFDWEVILDDGLAVLETVAEGSSRSLGEARCTPRLPTGQYRLTVRPSADSGLVPSTSTVTITDGADRLVTVQLEAQRASPVRLVAQGQARFFKGTLVQIRAAADAASPTPPIGLGSLRFLGHQVADPAPADVALLVASTDAALRDRTLEVRILADGWKSHWQRVPFLPIGPALDRLPPITITMFPD